jgi:hypothetical protein
MLYISRRPCQTPTLPNQPGFLVFKSLFGIE